jgi:hypothetical protein
MKKIIISASLAALGVASLQAANTTGLTATEQAKPWSVSLSLRGFYDDNYATMNAHRADGVRPDDSFGVDVSPSFSLNFPMDQTLFSAGYTYGMRYYEGRGVDASGHRNPIDQSHQANVKLIHNFTEDYKLDVSDTFVVAQEAELLTQANQAGVPLTNLMRANGNNIHNMGAINLTGQVTRQLGFLAGYSNNLYDYDDPAYQALLNRMEHMITLNLRWQLQPETVGILGYQFGLIDQTSEKGLPGIFVGGVPAYMSPEVRNSRSHYFYVGADHTFNPQFTGSVRVGMQYTEYPNAGEARASGVNFENSNLSPYADANITYNYLPGSTAQLGVKHTRVQTDMLALDQEATTMYAAVNHMITAKLTASLIGQYQIGTLNAFQTSPGATSNSYVENYFLLGANLGYQINQYLKAEAGYNFDRVDSDVNERSFSRNRVYLGLRASY